MVVSPTTDSHHSSLIGLFVLIGFFDDGFDGFGGGYGSMRGGGGGGGGMRNAGGGQLIAW